MLPLTNRGTDLHLWDGIIELLPGLVIMLLHLGQQRWQRSCKRSVCCAVVTQTQNLEPRAQVPQLTSHCMRYTAPASQAVQNRIGR